MFEHRIMIVGRKATSSPRAITYNATKAQIQVILCISLYNTKSIPAIVDVPLAPGKLRYATAGAPGPDDDLIHDEDYVSPPSPSPNPGSRRGIVNAGQHGSSRFCFCF
ncbi:hypothetical protein F4604DRAFT_1917801 [Suillus subluteus]|nr:hypothetical protein F4604DRAFT_1917801 [Suillus subluteus]